MLADTDLNNFRQIHDKYENYSWRWILILTFTKITKITKASVQKPLMRTN